MSRGPTSALLRRRCAAATLAALALMVGGAYYYFVQVELPHFQTVRQGVLYRSGQPHALGMYWLRTRGIRTVVGLRRPDNEGTIEAARYAEQHGMRYVNIPVGSSSENLATAAREFLDVVEDESNWPVLVHCARGKERSGVMSAVYRIEHDGWTNQAALEEGFELGMTKGRMPVAEGFILGYRPAGFGAAPTEPGTGVAETPWIEAD